MTSCIRGAFLEIFPIIDGEILGRKKLHKIVYLLQSAGYEFGYDYRFHFFGVYSDDLAADLREAVSDGFVEETLEVQKGYRIRTTDKFHQLVSNGQDAPQYSGLAADLARKNVEELEAISTVVFLRRSYFRSPELEKRFGVLKPHLLQYLNDSMRAADEILQNQAAG